VWDGGSDGPHDIIIGNMQKWCLRTRSVGTYEGVGWGIVIKKREYPCSTCFDRTAMDWNGTVGNNLATAAILLIVDTETHHIRKAWVVTKLCEGDRLFV